MIFIFIRRGRIPQLHLETISLMFFFFFFVLGCVSLNNPRWIVGPWESCSVTCGGGVKERQVYCQQGRNDTKASPLLRPWRNLSFLIFGIFSQVDDVICSALIGHKARTHEPCNTHECPNWFEGPWSQVKRKLEPQSS